nr:hypothetical protein [Tanacetum cinerariifolium]
YDANDEDKDNEDEEEEEDHLALADFVMVIPIDELVAPPEGIESIIPPPSTETATIGARITIQLQTSISLSPEMHGPSCDTIISTTTIFISTTAVDRRDSILESEQPSRKRLCLATLGSRYEVGESSTRGQGVDYGFIDIVEAEMRHRGIREVGYGIRDTWIDPTEADPDMASTTLEKVNTSVTELAELHEHNTQDLYALLEDAQDGRTRISPRVAIDLQRVDLLMGDRTTLQETVWIMKEEAYPARKAWTQLVGLNQIAHHEL